MSERIHSYPSIRNVGHPDIAAIFDDPVLVEEKIDGSQISFCKTKNGDLWVRSKRADIFVDDTSNKMFNLGVAAIKAVESLLIPDAVYRGEYLQKPKHNVLCYNRIPDHHIIIFDIETTPNVFVSPEAKREEAERLGFECVPVLYEGMVDGLELFLKLLDTESCLGGPKIEGVVCKNYQQFGRDGKVKMAKHVSEAFKEVHGKDWKERNPNTKDAVLNLITQLKTEARWQKAVQHLAEEGKLERSPKDIGNVLKEVKDDLLREEADYIKEALYKHFIGKILRGATAGLPEWYKSKLLEQQFEENTDES